MSEQFQEARLDQDPYQRFSRTYVPFIPRGATAPFPVIDMGNCMTKLVASVVGGGAMGMIFGPIFSSSAMSSVDHDPNATFRQKVFSV